MGWFKEHGFCFKRHDIDTGVGYEKGWTPHKSTVARATPSRFYEDSELPKVPLKTSDEHKKKSRGSLKKLIQNIPSIKRGKKEAQAVALPTMESVTDNVIDRYFRNMPSDSTNVRGELRADILAVVDKVDAKDKAWFVEIIAMHLAGACGQSIAERNPATAMQVLSCLQSMPLVDLIQGDAELSGQPASIQKMAWNMAYSLSSGGTLDYAALEKITLPIPASQKRHLKNLLGACFNMIEHGKHDKSPASTQSPGELFKWAKNNHSFLGEAVQGWHQILCSKEKANAWDNLVKNEPRLAIAANFVRNKHFDDASGSTVDKGARRSKKIPVWIARAIKRYNKTSRPADPLPENSSRNEKINAFTSKLKDRTRTLAKTKGRDLKKSLLPFRNKTPIEGFLKNPDIVMNAHSSSLDESKKIKLLLGELKHAHLDTIAEILRPLTSKEVRIGAAKKGGSEDDFLLQHCRNLKQKLSVYLVKIAILEIWEKRNIMAVDRGRPLANHEIKMVHQRLRELGDPAKGDITAQLNLQDRIDALWIGVKKRLPEKYLLPLPLLDDAPVTDADRIEISRGMSPGQDDLRNIFDIFRQSKPQAVLTPEFVREWADDAKRDLFGNGLPVRKPTMKANWENIDRFFHRWEGNVPAVEIPDFLSSAQDVIDVLQKIAAGNELVSSVKSTEGFTAGIDSKNRLTVAFIPGMEGVDDKEGESGRHSDENSTSGFKEYVGTALDIAGAPQKFLTQVTVPVIPGGRFAANGGRDVYMEYRVDAAAVSMAFGSQVKGQVEIAGNARSGPNVGITTPGGNHYNVMGGGHLNGGFRYEDTRSSGVVVFRMGGRIGRNQTAEIDGKPTIAPGMGGDTARKDEFEELNAALLSPVTQEEKNKGIQSPLHRAMLIEDASYTYQQLSDAKETKFIGQGKFGVGAFFARNEGRIGPTADLVVEGNKQFSSWNVVEERQGATRVYRETGVVGLKGIISVSALGSMVQQYLDSHPERNIGIGSEAFSYNGDFFNRAMTVRRDLTFENEDVQPAVSFMECRHQTVAGWVASVLENFDKWTLAVIKRDLTTVPKEDWPATPPLNMDRTSQEYREKYAEYEVLRQEAARALLVYLAQLLEKPDSAKSYSHWYTLSPDKAELINKHRAKMRAAKRLNDTAEVARQEKIAQSIFRDDASWVETLNFNAKSLKKDTHTGFPNMGLIYRADKSIESTVLETLDG